MLSKTQNTQQLEHHLIIGVGDFAASNNPNTILSTFALGSCIGVIGYDSELNIAGMLHLMLPDSKLATEATRERKAVFADTGLNLMMRTLLSMGVRLHRMRFIIAGGATIFSGNDFFQIGQRNSKAVLHFMSSNNLQVVHQDMGGSVNRTLHFHLSNGMLLIKTPNGTETIQCYKR